MDFDLAGLIGSETEREGKVGDLRTSGRDIHSTYEFLEELGKGAYGVVTKARHKLAGTVVAIKQIDKRAAGSKGLKSVFSEVEVLSVLRHPSIVHLEETYEDPHNLWLVLEYVAGGELETELRKHRFFPEATVRRIIGHLLLAMEHIHGKSIVHRDLKPANMLVSGRLDEGGNCDCKIADFGFSCVVTNEATLTNFCGTTAYMAPEILLDAPYGKPVDMWAIGVITYLLVCGSFPFCGQTEGEVADSIIECRLTFPDKRTDGGSPPSDGCRDFIARLLVSDDKARLSATEALHHWWVRGTSGDAMELDFYGADDLAGSGAPAAAGGVTGRKHPRLRWRKAMLFVRAAHRLVFWSGCKQLQEHDCDIPLFHNLAYLVGGHVEPQDGQILASGQLQTARGIQRVCEVVEQSRTVEVLDLSNNNLSYESLQLVARAAAAAPRLSVLNLSNNPVNTLGGRALMRLARSGKLKQIHLKGTLISAEVLQQIEQSLKDNDKPDRGGGGNRQSSRPSRGGSQVPPVGSVGIAPVTAPKQGDGRRPGGALGPAGPLRGAKPAAGAPSLFGSTTAAAASNVRTGGPRSATGATAPGSSLPRIGGNAGSSAVKGGQRASSGSPAPSGGHRSSGVGRR
eukprot:Hpha_TRINITY_DN15336_c0_g2::TRINITY_DN15336_c0_g2_i1::g.87966::m.87966